MASTITIRLAADRDDTTTQAALDRAFQSFRNVDTACTRFSPSSPLMTANAAGESWVAVGPICFGALVAAHEAYCETGGRFDPRVHDDLVRLGYDRSMQAGGVSSREEHVLQARSCLPTWRPEFRSEGHQVRVGKHAVDLGGIGKGLAVRHAARHLDRLGVGYLIDAGGDCWCGGASADGGPWRIAVEDPSAHPSPIAVLALRDVGVATSSVRICQWRIGTTRVHHLIDPLTGQPGGAGLAAVTVVAGDTADAEIWSKTLFLEGRNGIEAAARARGVAALWVDDDGELTMTPELADAVIWRDR